MAEPGPAGPTWVLSAETWGPDKTRVLVVSRGQDGQADSEGPSFYSAEEVERFIAELREKAREAFPDGELAIGSAAYLARVQALGLTGPVSEEEA